MLFAALFEMMIVWVKGLQIAKHILGNSYARLNVEKLLLKLTYCRVIEGHMRHCQCGRKCLRRYPLITCHLSVCHKTMLLCPNSETGSSNARISKPIISSWTNKAQSVAETCSLLWLQSGHGGESGFFQSLNSFSISLFSICECFRELTALFNCDFLP